MAAVLSRRGIQSALSRHIRYTPNWHRELRWQGPIRCRQRRGRVRYARPRGHDNGEHSDVEPFAPTTRSSHMLETSNCSSRSSCSPWLAGGKARSERLLTDHYPARQRWTRMEPVPGHRWLEARGGLMQRRSLPAAHGQRICMCVRNANSAESYVGQRPRPCAWLHADHPVMRGRTQPGGLSPTRTERRFSRAWLGPGS
jgi:hypothetical protein